MKNINYEDIYQKSYKYYNKKIKSKEETEYLSYIYHSIFYNLILDVILYKNNIKINKDTLDFILDKKIDLNEVLQIFI